MIGAARRNLRASAWLAAALVASAMTLSACTEDPATESPTEETVSEGVEPALEIDSQFTRDGTFQSHLSAPGAEGMDFVYTLYPTKATPRTNEWYPLGEKFFSFTFQAYDLSQKLRDPFESKREVYLDRIKVTSSTITADGSATESPYRLNAEAANITFDPEPARTKRGMLITSPKGAFELRNQSIAPMALDTRGVELTFSAKVFIETEAGSDSFVGRTIEQVVPIAIFESDEPTQAADIPINAN